MIGSDELLLAPKCLTFLVEILHDAANTSFEAGANQIAISASFADIRKLVTDLDDVDIPVGTLHRALPGQRSKTG